MSAPRFMLDTNIVSDLIRNPAGRVAARIRFVGDHGLAVSIITAAELRFGAAKSGSATLSARVEAALAAIEVLPFDRPADGAYAEIRAALEASGRPIGPNDLLIAAHAVSLGTTIVTGNVAEFARVKGLTVENWLT